MPSYHRTLHRLSRILLKWKNRNTDLTSYATAFTILLKLSNTHTANKNIRNTVLAPNKQTRHRDWLNRNRRGTDDALFEHANGYYFGHGTSVSWYYDLYYSLLRFRIIKGHVKLLLHFSESLFTAQIGSSAIWVTFLHPRSLGVYLFVESLVDAALVVVRSKISFQFNPTLSKSSMIFLDNVSEFLGLLSSPHILFSIFEKQMPKNFSLRLVFNELHVSSCLMNCVHNRDNEMHAILCYLYLCVPWFLCLCNWYCPCTSQV